MNISLSFERLKLALQKRSGVTKNKKDYASWAAKGHIKQPIVSVIIQSHNKSAQVLHVLPKLRKFGDVEIIVIDDGSDLTHTQALAKALTGANEFLLRANDLYENITYDKSIRLANGKYIALLQDDDDFDGIRWMEQAVSLFESHPRMAILGGKDGLSIRFEDDAQWAHGGEKQQQGSFCFVQAVNRAPMWINRELFVAHLRHIDYRFAPFQFDDYELCARAWLCGLQVGWYDAGFRSLSVGGMRLWNNAFTKEQSLKNGKLLYSLYREHKERIDQLLSDALSSLA